MNVHYDIEVIGLSDVLEYEQILRIELILNIYWEVISIARKIVPGNTNFRKIDWLLVISLITGDKVKRSKKAFLWQKISGFLM